VLYLIENQEKESPEILGHQDSQSCEFQNLDSSDEGLKRQFTRALEVCYIEYRESVVQEYTIS
jgi:hypothetical protein